MGNVYRKDLTLLVKYIIAIYIDILQYVENRFLVAVVRIDASTAAEGLTLFHCMGLLPDTQNCGLRMRRECRERFPLHH